MNQNREEQIKSAFVVRTDEIAFASQELNRAAELAAYQLHQFVDYIQQIDTQLTRTEATVVTACVLENLPALFEMNPLMIESIKRNAAYMRSGIK